MEIISNMNWRMIMFKEVHTLEDLKYVQLVQAYEGRLK